MKIILADHFGLCFGVRDAIAHAEELAAEGPLTVLGELVHNPVVRERLRRRGVIEGSLNAATAQTPRVMITAHGTSDVQRTRWSTRAAFVADATCPLVRQAHEQLRRLVAQGYFAVVVGQRGHVEVAGLIGDFTNAFVLSAPEEVAQLPQSPRYGIIAQTTQPIDFVESIVDLVRRRFPESEVRFVDTVCKPTKDRQAALRKLIATVELVVVVGGHNSNNTRQLVEKCRAAGRRAIHVERPDELRAEDFAGIKRVGVTAGTSTLIETVEAVMARLRNFAPQSAENPAEDAPC